MLPTRYFAVAFAAAISVLGLPGVAAADGADQPQVNLEEAKAHYKRARELYDENNFRAALVEMQRAHDLSGNERLLYDIGQINYQLQDYPAALTAFTKYLSSNKGDVPPARLEEVKGDIDRLKNRVATLRITVSKPGAQVVVDDSAIGPAPLAEPVLVGTGRHKILATADGESSVPKTVDVAGGETVDVSLVLGESSAKPEHPSPSLPPPPEEKKGPSAMVIVPWTITGGLAIATIATGAVALTKSSQLSTDLKTPGITRQTLDDAHSSTKTMAAVTDVLLGTTIAAAGCSIILTVVAGNQRSHHDDKTHDDKTGEKPKAAALSVRVGPGNVGLVGSF